jgi:hypothetical protein
LLDTCERYREVLAAWAVRDDTEAADRPVEADAGRSEAARTPVVGGE